MLDFKWISPGELAKDQWVTILGLRPQTKEIIIPTGEKVEITEEDRNPFIKGIPFRVLNVKLPLVMLHNITMAPNIPPVVFYDTRLVEFLEVDEEYAVLYARHMYPQQLPQVQPVVVELPPSSEGENGDPQQTFNFGPEDEGGDEDGPPPLVPV